MEKSRFTIITSKVSQRIDLIVFIPLLISVRDEVYVPWARQNSCVTFGCYVTQVLVPFFVLGQNARIFPDLNYG